MVCGLRLEFILDDIPDQFIRRCWRVLRGQSESGESSQKAKHNKAECTCSRRPTYSMSSRRHTVAGFGGEMKRSHVATPGSSVPGALGAPSAGGFGPVEINLSNCPQTRQVSQTLQASSRSAEGRSAA